MSISNSDFAELVMNMAKSAGKFEPTAKYDPDGDCIEFLFKPDCFYAERIDDLVTVYYSQDTKEVIGSLIKGVKEFSKKILNKYPGFKIEIHDGRVHLAHLFRARLWSQSPQNKIAVKTYQKLIEHAEKSETEAELLFA